MTKLVFIHVPIRNMYFLSGMEGFKKSEGRSTRGASSLQNWLRPPPQNWMRPYDSCSSAPTALMKKLSTANLLSIHVLILRIFVFGGATRIVGAGSRQSQIGLCTVVLLANPLPGASGLGKLTRFWPYFNFVDFRAYFGHFSHVKKGKYRMPKKQQKLASNKKMLENKPTLKFYFT